MTLVYPALVMTTSSPASHLQADTDDLTMGDDESSSTTLLDRIRNFVQKELLFVLTLAGVAAGLVVGRWNLTSYLFLRDLPSTSILPILPHGNLVNWGRLTVKLVS